MKAEEYIKDYFGEYWLKYQWEIGDVIDALEEYAEQRIEEELFKFFNILHPNNDNAEFVVDEYLKQREK